MDLRLTLTETPGQRSGSIRRSVSSSIGIAARRRCRRAHRYAPKRMRTLRKRRSVVANGRKTTIPIPRQGDPPTADRLKPGEVSQPALIVVEAGGPALT